MLAMRTLRLERDVDVSGVSGTGTVAYGVRFPDGSVVLRWDTGVHSTVIYESVGDVEKITGHGGRTRIVWTEGEGERARWVEAAQALSSAIEASLRAAARWTPGYSRFDDDHDVTNFDPAPSEELTAANRRIAAAVKALKTLADEP